MFLCYGNICLSPFAAGVWNRELGTARSAGFIESEGRTTPATYRRLAAAHGVDLSGHGSRYASPQLIDWAQAIVVMDRHNLEDLRRLYPEAEERTFPLGAFLEQPRQEIEDPYYLDLERATQVYAQMHQAVTTMLSFQ
ncbi:MAG: hypothetical protein KC910_03685 [Candidatus Eremiobacteraeota bacterium]|nr:hypothetical protein [Candidatus Eremiobacteraeota bacterium]